MGFVKKAIDSFQLYFEHLMTRLGLGMRAKLIIIFVVIKVIPLVLLALLAWRQAWLLGEVLALRTQELNAKANEALSRTGDIAVKDSVVALNARATDDIERMTTDTARRVADFLYNRDDDILFIAALEPEEANYRNFIEKKGGNLIKQGPWKLAPDGKSWVPVETRPSLRTVLSTNGENDLSFHYRQPDQFEYESRPLYLEATFVDMQGNELIKVVTSPHMSRALKNVSDRRNTYVRAETYFAELCKLKPGEIYVSDVIGAYVPSRLIGMYTPENAASRGLDFRPEEEAYAGKENPLGRRFHGIVRWATPVVRGGRIIGYVTLALDHDHIMEFTSHIIPTKERYTEIPSAYEGNYAFIWDYKCRSIVHPRHHSIVGYDPETGEPQIPWLEESIFENWRASGKNYVDFINDVPTFFEQSVKKKPAKELTEKGLVGLDGRYLNFAPQCTGWFDLTSEGGSGSFVILWSGLTKLTTAASIPYYTGHYGASRRGFGFVTIGAGLDDFQRPAKETERVLGELIKESDSELSKAAGETKAAIDANLLNTAAQLAISAGVMIVLVIMIAIWMASIFTGSITNLINGISRFRAGERHFRFNAPVKDEMGMLADSFDEMADSLEASVKGPLVITDMDYKVVYINEYGLNLQKKTLDEVLGAPYGEVSIYPIGSRYCPITALHEGREADVLYLSEKGAYVRGSASYLTDKDGRNVGHIIVTTDVTEIAEEQEELRRTKLELENAVLAANKANESKGEFLARMSHEIRTPMNAIIGLTNIVRRKLDEPPEGTEEIRAHVRQIENSSQHLLGLLNDILDISKIEAGKVELAEETVDLPKLASTVAGIIRPRCEEKNIAFDASFYLAAPSVFITDPLRLRQVLINLLGNAVKFTPECGRVEFRIEQKERLGGKALIEFSVLDSGIGIPEDAFSTLFLPFEQVSGQVSRRYGGTGLGLAISRSIVQLMGGDIAVSSREGEGSVFSFSLWLTESEILGQDEEETVNVVDRFAGKRALLVDDVAVNRIIVTELLSATGIAIDEAEDGLMAVQMFESSPENTYDIIYMDVQMPNMDGNEAAAAIRALDRADAETVSIVALTANAFKEDMDKSIQHGMNAHLAKPVEYEKLIEVTIRMLEER